MRNPLNPVISLSAIGGQTGRDGIHGATFLFRRIGRHLRKSRQCGADWQPDYGKEDRRCVATSTRPQPLSLDNRLRAGGFSSAVGEMGEPIGAEVHLERVSLKYEGLAPWEIWLSEAQERMVIAVPPENLSELMEICEAKEVVEATVLGTFTDTHNYRGFL